jgi:ribosomal protein L3 glutamine methyltransferase
MTLIDTIDQCAERLQEAGVSFGHGTDNAFDEACWLALWRLGLPLDDLETFALRALSSEEVGSIRALVLERISSRKPAAYLTREAWLHGVSFYVDERAIVPRSLIAELLVQGALDPWIADSARCALDLCTGNGSLAVLAALAYPGLALDASDLSAGALEVAAINLRRHGLQSRVRLIECAGLPPASARSFDAYDLILCNPPYVNQQSLADLPAEYLAEPRVALDGGADGMDFIRPLLKQAAGAMRAKAALVLEVGHERGSFERAFPTLQPLWLETSGGPGQVLLLERGALTSFAGP